MLAQEPDGMTIGTPGVTESRKRRARAVASARIPSLNATWPQQNARRSGRTLSWRRSSTMAAASPASGKNSSARQVEKSWTSVIARPGHEYIKRLGAVHAEHDALFDIRGAAGPGDERHAMAPDEVGADHRERGGEVGEDAINVHDDEARGRQQGQ